MSNVVQVPASPANYTVGRLGYRVSGIIIHTIVGTLGSADATFANPGRGASAHYGVACDGSVCHQYVGEQNIAWHCGRFYPDAANPLGNANTIGIEHCDNGQPNSPRSDEEYACSAQLVREVCARYAIPIDRAHIRKHTEVSVLYTACPDTLDINRIVREAAGAPPPSPQGDDDMLYVGPFHPLAASLRAFAAGSVYRDPAANALVVEPVSAGASPLVVDGYLYSSSPVQSSDIGGGVAGPDHVWWRRAKDKAWFPDAILDTSALAGAPAAGVPAGEVLNNYFAVAGTTGPSGPDDDSQYATKADLQAVKDAIPTKASGNVSLALSK